MACEKCMFCRKCSFAVLLESVPDGKSVAENDPTSTVLCRRSGNTGKISNDRFSTGQKENMNILCFNQKQIGQ
jgi:hypothetical protein